MQGKRRTCPTVDLFKHSSLFRFHFFFFFFLNNTLAVKQQFERDMVLMKRSVEEHKRAETEAKSSLFQHEKQLQKLQLMLQQTGGELREAALHIQTVRIYFYLVVIISIKYKCFFYFIVVQEKSSCFNAEQRCASQRNHLEELQNQLAQQEKVNQDEKIAIQRLETELSLVRAELERAE